MTARYTILVIDDDPEILQLISELLTHAGHHVLTAPEGAAGLITAKTSGADLILLDYHMPGLDGLAVLERLKADATTRAIPVIALTSASSEDANALSRAGALAFIPKPFAPTEFVQNVAEMLSATARRRRRADRGP